MIMKYFFHGKVALGHEGKNFFRGKVQKEGNYFFPVVVLIVTSLSWERNCSRLLGQCSLDADHMHPQLILTTKRVFSFLYNSKNPSTILY